MGSPSDVPESPRDGLPKQAVRKQLERILASEIFSRSVRLSSFLRFAVEETLAGRGSSLKEQVLAIELYGQWPGSINEDNSIVRADARRLRDKLREFYAEAGGEPVIISLPKGSYTPVFETNAAAAAPMEVPFPVRRESSTTPTGRFARNLRFWIAAVAAVILLGTSVAWQLLRAPAPPLKLVPLTTYPGEPIAIASVESAPFLTVEQKRDISYYNATRFFRMKH